MQIMWLKTNNFFIRFLNENFIIEKKMWLNFLGFIII